MSHIRLSWPSLSLLSLARHGRHHRYPSPDLGLFFSYLLLLHSSPFNFSLMSDPTLRIKTSSPAMPPITRSRARAMEAAAVSSPVEDDPVSDLESDSGMTDYDTEESPSTVRSPTNLLYSLERLSDETKAAVADTMREPPLIALEHCRRINETYAFQMKELVTRSIRIRAPGSDGPRLSCSCRAEVNAGGHEDDAEPCPHLVWLLDQLLKETLYDHDEKQQLTMMPSGYAEEMGDPFSTIAGFHLDILAPGLHCPLLDPEAGYEAAADPTRVLEARELLAPYYSSPHENFRPDVFTRPDEALGGALDRAVFNALLEDNHFFHHLLSQARSTDPVKDPFRKLSQRVDRVLRDLDMFVSSPTADRWLLETPSDVSWAASHILGSVNMTKAIIFNRDQPLLHTAAASAASTLVHVLEAVVSRNKDVPSSNSQSRRDRNLYLRLIGDRDQGFVIDVLGLVPAAASQYVHRLEAALERISIYGAPLSYVDKFRSLLRRLRATRFAAT